MLEYNNCRYHIAQISSANAVDIIRERKNKINFSCGVSINNLSLNENDIGDFKTFLKLSPPLRTEDDRLSLVKAINNDLLDVIETGGRRYSLAIIAAMRGNRRALRQLDDLLGFL